MFGQGHKVVMGGGAGGRGGHYTSEKGFKCQAKKLGFVFNREPCKGFVPKEIRSEFQKALPDRVGGLVEAERPGRGWC